MKSRISRIISIKLINAGLLAASLAGTDAFATEVYHWKDANGSAHFSDQRAAANGASTMTVAAPEQRPNPELDQYRQSVRVNLAMLDAERKAMADREASRQIVARSVQRNCRNLRNAIRAEETAAVLYTFDEAGDRQHLDDKQRNDYKASLNQQWQRSCD